MWKYLLGSVLFLYAPDTVSCCTGGSRTSPVECRGMASCAKHIDTAGTRSRIPTVFARTAAAGVETAGIIQRAPGIDEIEILGAYSIDSGIAVHENAGLGYSKISGGVIELLR